MGAILHSHPGHSVNGLRVLTKEFLSAALATVHPGRPRAQLKFTKCIQDVLSSRTDVDLTAQYIKACAELDDHLQPKKSLLIIMQRTGELHY
jgi:hypothetical protein